ncbi:MAG: hypothetical protein QXX77_10500 [Candidatus Methanosuratincola sp.]
MKERVSKRLWEIARERVLSYGFLLSDDAKGLILDEIAAALDNMEREGVLEDAESQIRVKTNMMKLVDLMVEDARVMGDAQDSLELGRHNFDAAMRKLRALFTRN